MHAVLGFFSFIWKMAENPPREYLPDNDLASAGGHTTSNSLSDLSLSIGAGLEALDDGRGSFADFGIDLHLSRRLAIP